MVWCGVGFDAVVLWCDVSMISVVWLCSGGDVNGKMYIFVVAVIVW